MKASQLAIGMMLCATSTVAFSPSGVLSSPSPNGATPVNKAHHTPSSRTASSSRTALNMSSRPGGGRDFYSILGVSRSADKSEIKSAYRKLAKKYHPDANPNKDTTAEFQEVNRVYEVLGDDDKRKKYDMFGEAGVGSSAASEGGGPYGYGSPFGGAGFSQEVDLGDIFDSFFGGGPGGPGGAGFGGGRGRGGRRAGPMAGDDLRFDLEIDFKTAVFGGEEKVRIRHLETCDTCGGNGVKPGSKVSTCSTCNGMGVTMQVTRTPLGNFQTQQTCPDCRGTGQKVEEYCGTCSGEGNVSKTKQIKVDIPPGVEDGNKLRVRGEGDAGPSGGPAGDLYIFLKVKPDPNFRREGPEIYSEATVSYVDAILGASLKVPVVDGDVTIKVPPGTQPAGILSCTMLSRCTSFVLVLAFAASDAFQLGSAPARAQRARCAVPTAGLFDAFAAAFSNQEFDDRNAKAQHILLKGGDADSRSAAADTIKAQIEAGELSFEKAAKQFSECPSRAENPAGSLGQFSPGKMVAEFDEYIFNPKSAIGEIGIVETQFGTHLVKINERADKLDPSVQRVDGSPLF